MADVLDFNDAPAQRPDPVDYDRRLERLRAELPTRAEPLVRELFPLAVLTQHEARIGNVDGEPGESMSIGLTGDRAGLWFDHATGQGGDLIDLWQVVSRADDFRAVVDDLERWCGWSKQPRWTSPVVKLAEVRRIAAADAPKASPQPTGEPSGAWAYLDAEGALLATVKRYDGEGGKKTYRPFLPSGVTGMPTPRPLYNQPALTFANRVVLVEGEKCADALASLGIAATTQMGGASANPDKTDWSPLAGKHVVIWPDNDAPGLAMPAKVRAAIEAVAASVTILAPPADRPPKWDAADAVAEGFNIPALLGAAPERPKVPIYSRRQLRALKRPEWLIDEVVAEASVLSLYGPSGSLKSFVAIDMGMSVACGVSWHGRDVKQGPVVYVTGEGRDQISGRLDAWERSREVATDDAPIFIVPMGIAVSDPQWVRLLIDAIRGVCSDAPVMIWLDTLARTFGAGDENSQKDMNAFITGMDRLRDAFRCVVGVVHHTGKEDSKGLRGSSALYAAMDTVIKTERAAGAMLVTLKNAQPHGKQKDASEFEDIALLAEIVGLGVTDKKGRELTSVALKLTEKPTADTASDAVRRFSPNEESVLLALAQAAASGQSLGFMRLLGVTGMNQGSLSRILAKMTEKGAILEIEEGGRKCWMLP